MVPYFPVLVEKLGNCLFGEGAFFALCAIESQDELLRANATTAIGKLAVAVGLELFKPYLEKFSQKVLSDAQKEQKFQMSEAAYSYFGDMALVLGEGAGPMLSTIVPMILKSCISREGIKEEFQEKPKDEIDLGDDEPEDEGELKSVAIHTAFLQEKIGAIHALGRFAKCCPKGFLPYMPKCLESIKSIWDFFHESVRYQAIQTLGEFVEGVNLAYFGKEHPRSVPGIPAKVKMCEDATKLYFDHVLPKFLETLKEDEDREVVSRTLESLCDLIKAIGPAVIEDRLPLFVECIMILLAQKAMCMREDSDEEEDDEEEGKAGKSKAKAAQEEEDDEEELDHDEMLIVNIVELIQDLAKATGSAIIPMYSEVLEILMKYTRAPHPENDCVVAVGCFTDLFRSLPEIIPQYGPKIMPLCLKGCRSGKNDITRNSAYCLGILTEYGKDFVVPHINEIMAALKSAYELPKAAEPRDNAVSSLLRLFVAHPDKIPVEMVLPAIFDHLPLNGDVEENNNVARSLILVPSESKLAENIVG